MSKVSDRELNRLTAELYNRINSDAKFAARFDKDRAAAMKELFPAALANVPKKELNEILSLHTGAVEKAYLDALKSPDVVARLPPGTARLLRAAATFALNVAASYVASALASSLQARNVPE